MQTPADKQFLDRASPPHIATLILLAGVSAMVMNMFLPSLPNMAAYFDADYGLMQLSVSLYLGFSALLQIIIGPVADKMGRRPVLLVSIGLFLVATLGCIFAPNAQVFLVFRMCQALIAVAMVLSRAVVRDLFDEDKSASMLGYVTMGMAVVPMISPALGGFLDEQFGWKANFWFFFITGLMLFALTWADLGETGHKSGKTLLQQFREYPELIRSPRFWGYSLAAAFGSGAFFAYLGGAPYVASEVFGMSPSTMGLYFGAPAIGYFLGNWVTGRFAVHLGINRMVLLGSLANILGTALSLAVFLAGYGAPLVFFGFMTLVGIGNGLVIPNATSGMLSVRPHLAGTASGFGGAIMIGGGAALSALVGLLLTPASGAFPLLWLQFGTSAAALAAVFVVFWRERRMGSL